MAFSPTSLRYMQFNTSRSPCLTQLVRRTVVTILLTLTELDRRSGDKLAAESMLLYQEQVCSRGRYTGSRTDGYLQAPVALSLA